MVVFWLHKYPCLLGIHSEVHKGDGTLDQQITVKLFTKKFLNCISTNTSVRL